MNNRDLACAQTIARDLDRARDLTRALAREIDLADARVLPLIRARIRARALTREIGLTDACLLAHFLASRISLARARARARDLDNARALDHVLKLARDRAPGLLEFDHARELASARDLVGRITGCLTNAHYRTHELASALANAHELASAKDGPPDNSGRSQCRVTPAAARLLTVAAGLLPPADRARYAEEFRSELWELARAGAARRAQVAYAARQIRSAVRLRAALRTPARRGATP